MTPRVRSFAWGAVRWATGVALALLTMAWVAGRVYNCPTEFHPVFGYVIKPFTPIRYQLEGEGSGFWTSNNVRRAALPGPTQKPVLLILGDSYVEGLNVHTHEFFASLLEQWLAASNQTAAVLPAGRSDYSVADYVSKAPVFQQMFHPSWVVIEVREDDFLADAWQPKLNACARFCYQEPAHTLALAESGPPPAPPSRLGLRQSLVFFRPLFQFGERRFQEFRLWLADRDQPWFHAAPTPPPPPTAPADALDHYPVPAEMRMLAAAYHQRVTLLFLPAFDPRDPARESPTEARLRAWAEEAGLRFRSLREQFPALARAGVSPYGFSNTRFNYGHWNRYGHAAAAAVLTDEYQKISHDLH
jgi:hypothetical protein